jgi:2-iminobutanoate/2-iminopropanoate deaminase
MSAHDGPAYPPARRRGSLVVTSGQTGEDADGDPVGPDMRTQARAALEHVRRALESEGGSFGDVLRVEAFLAHPDGFAAWDEAFRECFPTDPPARTTVIAAPPGEGFLIELQAVALVADR